jgi:hypothetical protein
MSVDFLSDWEQTLTTTAFYAIKLCRIEDNKLKSGLHPRARVRQEVGKNIYCKHPGEDFEYKMGVQLHSPPDSPGIYLFQLCELGYLLEINSRDESFRRSNVITIVQIPTLSFVRYGQMLASALVGYAAWLVKPKYFKTINSTSCIPRYIISPRGTAYDC